MLAHEIPVGRVTSEQLGWATTESIRTEGGERLLPKGGVIDEDVLARWSEIPDGTLHLIEREPGDLHENIAGRRVSEAVSGPGIEIKGPFNSRYNLNSRHKGLLIIDERRVHAINETGDLSLFTRFSEQAVTSGQTVAGVKATPIVVTEADVKRIEAIAVEGGSKIVDVLPFRAREAAVVATESLHPRLRESFEERVRDKLSWYGASGCTFAYVDPDSEQVARAVREAFDRGADLVMAAGGNTLDPLDPVLQSLALVGAEMVHYGAPADPGSMFWVASVDGRPIFNLASCSMYSEATVIDLMLPFVFAGREITAAMVARLGYGGLLEDDMTFRFPNYDAE
ncbi:molybdopterin-binding protein [soil metagenome]